MYSMTESTAETAVRIDRLTMLKLLENTPILHPQYPPKNEEDRSSSSQKKDTTACAKVLLYRENDDDNDDDDDADTNTQADHSIKGQSGCPDVSIMGCVESRRVPQL